MTAARRNAEHLGYLQRRYLGTRGHDDPPTSAGEAVPTPALGSEEPRLTELERYKPPA